MFDVLVAGDGELAILHALQPNAPTFLDGDDHKGPLFMSDAIYDASPPPSRHLVDLASYHYSIEDRRSNWAVRSIVAFAAAATRRAYASFVRDRPSRS
jgi:hypothetical protein